MLEVISAINWYGTYDNGYLVFGSVLLFDLLYNWAIGLHLIKYLESANWVMVIRALIVALFMSIYMIFLWPMSTWKIAVILVLLLSVYSLFAFFQKRHFTKILLIDIALLFEFYILKEILRWYILNFFGNACLEVVLLRL